MAEPTEKIAAENEAVRNSSVDEKHDVKEDVEETTTEAEVFDPFVPFPESGIEEGRILSIRAVFVGSILGGLVNASNVYLGKSTVFLPLTEVPVAILVLV